MDVSHYINFFYKMVQLNDQLLKVSLMLGSAFSVSQLSTSPRVKLRECLFQSFYFVAAWPGGSVAANKTSP